MACRGRGTRFLIGFGAGAVASGLTAFLLGRSMTLKTADATASIDATPGVMGIGIPALVGGLAAGGVAALPKTACSR